MNLASELIKQASGNWSTIDKSNNFRPDSSAGATSESVRRTRATNIADNKWMQRRMTANIKTPKQTQQTKKVYRKGEANRLKINRAIRSKRQKKIAENKAYFESPEGKEKKRIIKEKKKGEAVGTARRKAQEAIKVEEETKKVVRGQKIQTAKRKAQVRIKREERLDKVKKIAPALKQRADKKGYDMKSIDTKKTPGPTIKAGGDGYDMKSIDTKKTPGVKPGAPSTKPITPSGSGGKWKMGLGLLGAAGAGVGAKMGYDKYNE